MMFAFDNNYAVVSLTKKNINNNKVKFLILTCKYYKMRYTHSRRFRRGRPKSKIHFLRNYRF